MDPTANSEERPFRILLADDNDSDLMLTAATLKRSHVPFSLKTFNDGEDVLDFLLNRPPYQDEPRPDIVLLDINMNRLSGLETLEEVKKNSDFSFLPIFMLTGSQLDKEVALAKTLGANGFVVKGSNFALQNLLDYAAAAKHNQSIWVQVTQ